MTGFISKVIGVILAFCLLVVAPLINAYGIQEMEDRMNILNAVSEFLDKQTDKGIITDADLNEFYMEIESHGLTLDVQVSRYVKTATREPDGTISTTYIAADDTSILNEHDILQVHLQEMSVTPYRKLLRIFLKLDTADYTLDMAKMVK